MSSSVSTNPLLAAAEEEEDPEYLEFRRQQAQSSSCQRRSRVCAIYGCFAFAALFVFIVVSIKLIYFRHVDHGPPQVNNGTAIERNTGIEFPLHFQPKYFNNKGLQSLIGCDAWEYKIPIPTTPKVIVGALGLYVERTEARRRLSQFKNHHNEFDEQELEKATSALFAGSKSLGETLRVVMHGTPPNGRMLEWWDMSTKQARTKYCGEVEERVEFDQFVAFFGKRKFQGGDDLWFERRGDDGALFAWFKSHDPKRIASGCLGRALFEAHFRNQKSGLLNLLDELFA